MNESSLAITRKVVLCAGLLVAVLLLIYPHWRVSIQMGGGNPVLVYDVGRAFILSSPTFDSQQQGGVGLSPFTFTLMGGIQPVYRIHYARQIIEVALAALFTFLLMRALRKPGATPPDSNKGRPTDRLKEELERHFEKG